MGEEGTTTGNATRGLVTPGSRDAVTSMRPLYARQEKRLSMQSP